MKPRVPGWAVVVGAVAVVAIVAALSGMEPAYQFAADVIAIGIGGIVLAVQSASRRTAAEAKEQARHSPDRHWWWNGQAWQSAISEDGRSRWDGRTWVAREYSDRVLNAIDHKAYVITLLRNKPLDGWELQVVSLGGQKFWRWISDARGAGSDFDLEAAQLALVETVKAKPVAEWAMDKDVVAMVQTWVMDRHPADSEDFLVSR